MRTASGSCRHIATKQLLVDVKLEIVLEKNDEK